MSITHHKEDLLPNIPFNELDEQIFGTLARASRAEVQTLSGTIEFFGGKVKIRWEVDSSVPSAEATLVVLGVEIATVRVDTAKPCVPIKGSFTIVKWDLNLCLDLAKRQLRLEGVIVVKLLGSKEINVVLADF